MQRVRLASKNDDSIGGTVTCVIRRAPSGLGEPVFDKLEALLAHAMLSIPATKGFEIGSGFSGTELAGSKHNDAFVKREDGGLGTKTNKSGGVQGGISNGEDIYFKCVHVRKRGGGAGADGELRFPGLRSSRLRRSLRVRRRPSTMERLEFLPHEDVTTPASCLGAFSFVRLAVDLTHLDLLQRCSHRRGNGRSRHYGVRSPAGCPVFAY